VLTYVDFVDENGVAYKAGLRTGEIKIVIHCYSCLGDTFLELECEINNLNFKDETLNFHLNN
jgi:hypothetical protein